MVAIILKEYKAVVPGENPYINWQPKTDLRIVRESKGISCNTLAKLVGISISTLSEIETGMTFVNQKRLKQIADILDTDITLISKGLKTTILHKNVR